MDLWQIDPQIVQRCLEYHYTKLGRSAARTTSPLIDQRFMEDHYTASVSWHTDPPLLQLTIDPWKTITPNLADLLADIYSTMHIYLWQIYPHPLLQSSIDTLNTATPNLAHLMADLYIYIEQCTYIHGRLTPTPPIEHRCLEYCYTKLGTSIYI